MFNLTKSFDILNEKISITFKIGIELLIKLINFEQNLQLWPKHIFNQILTRLYYLISTLGKTLVETTVLGAAALGGALLGAGIQGGGLDGIQVRIPKISFINPFGKKK